MNEAQMKEQIRLLASSSQMWIANAEVLLRAAAAVSAHATEGHRRLRASVLAQRQTTVEGPRSMPEADVNALQDASTRTVALMLLASGIESILKATLVSRGTNLLDGRGVMRREFGHDLVSLSTKAGVVLSDDERNTLEVLTHFGVWRGRYPFPRSPADAADLWNRMGQNRLDLLATGAALVERLLQQLAAD